MGVLLFFGKGCVADVSVCYGVIAVGEQGITTFFLKLGRADRFFWRVVSLLGGTLTWNTGFQGKPVTGVFFLDSGVCAFRSVLIATRRVLVAGIGIVVRGGSFCEAVV